VSGYLTKTHHLKPNRLTFQEAVDLLAAEIERADDFARDSYRDVDLGSHFSPSDDVYEAVSSAGLAWRAFNRMAEIEGLRGVLNRDQNARLDALRKRLAEVMECVQEAVERDKVRNLFSKVPPHYRR